MSITAINWAYKIKAGSARNKAVLAVLANHANDDGKCWPRIRTLAAETELDERTVRLALDDLAKRGLINRKPQFLDGTKYRRADLLTLHLTPGQDDHSTHPGEAPAYPGDTPAYPGEAPAYIRVIDPVHPGDSPGHIEPSLNRKDEPPKNQTRGAIATVDKSFEKEFDERFWPTYPNKVGKPKAKAAFLKIRRAGKVPLERILGGLDAYCNKNDYRQWCSPSTWLN